MQRAILAAALLMIPVSAMAGDMQPGKYLIGGKIAGIPDSEQDTPEEKCLTQKDIDSGLTQIGIEGENKSCKVSDFKRGPGTVSYRMTCQEDGGNRVTDVKGTLAADRFDIRMVIRAGKETFNLAVSGKRVGAC